MSTAPYGESAEEARNVQLRQADAERRVRISLDEVQQLLTFTRDQILACKNPVAQGKVLQLALQKLRQTSDASFKEANAATKELHGAVQKLTKASRGTALDASFVPRSAHSALCQPVRHAVRGVRCRAGSRGVLG